MRLKYNFEIMEMEDEIVAVPTGVGAENFSGVLKLNESAVFILKLLKNDTTTDEIAEKIKENYETDDSVYDYVNEYVQGLRDGGLIID